MRGPVPAGRAQGADDRKRLATSTFSTAAPAPQLLDDLGHRLRPHRERIEGAPRRAVPSWHRLAVDRWAP